MGSHGGVLSRGIPGGSPQGVRRGDSRRWSRGGGPYEASFGGDPLEEVPLRCHLEGSSRSGPMDAVPSRCPL
jgi:hypothetical protein